MGAVSGAVAPRLSGGSAPGQRHAFAPALGGLGPAALVSHPQRTLGKWALDRAKMEILGSLHENTSLPSANIAPEGTWKIIFLFNGHSVRCHVRGSEVSFRPL